MFNPQIIIELRRRLGLNRKEFTALLGLKTRQTTRYWERGMKVPNLKSATKLIELAQDVGLELTLKDFSTPGE